MQYLVQEGIVYSCLQNYEELHIVVNEFELNFTYSTDTMTDFLHLILTVFSLSKRIRSSGNLDEKMNYLAKLKIKFEKLKFISDNTLKLNFGYGYHFAQAEFYKATKSKNDLDYLELIEKEHNSLFNCLDESKFLIMDAMISVIVGEFYFDEKGTLFY